MSDNVYYGGSSSDNKEHSAFFSEELVKQVTRAAENSAKWCAIDDVVDNMSGAISRFLKSRDLVTEQSSRTRQTSPTPVPRVVCEVQEVPDSYRELAPLVDVIEYAVNLRTSIGTYDDVPEPKGILQAMTLFIALTVTAPSLEDLRSVLTPGQALADSILVQLGDDGEDTLKFISEVVFVAFDSHPYFGKALDEYSAKNAADNLADSE